MKLIIKTKKNDKENIRHYILKLKKRMFLKHY